MGDTFAQVVLNLLNWHGIELIDGCDGLATVRRRGAVELVIDVLFVRGSCSEGEACQYMITCRDVSVHDRLAERVTLMGACYRTRPLTCHLGGVTGAQRYGEVL